MLSTSLEPVPAEHLLRLEVGLLLLNDGFKVLRISRVILKLTQTCSYKIKIKTGRDSWEKAKGLAGILLQLDA